MSYTSDRQCVERLLLPAMMQVIITVLRQNLGRDAVVLDPASELLVEALREPIDALEPRRANKVLRRAMRATREAMTAISDRLIGVQWLAIARLTMDLTDEDYLVVAPDSAFARAWDVMAEVMGAVLDDLMDDESVADAVTNLRRSLETGGFFRVT